MGGSSGASGEGLLDALALAGQGDGEEEEEGQEWAWIKEAMGD